MGTAEGIEQGVCGGDRTEYLVDNRIQAQRPRWNIVPHHSRSRVLLIFSGHTDSETGNTGRGQIWTECGTHCVSPKI